jgi:hypothetical protein
MQNPSEILPQNLYDTLINLFMNIKILKFKRNVNNVSLKKYQEKGQLLTIHVFRLEKIV